MRRSYRAAPVTGFDDDIALTPAGDGIWDGEITPGWHTPRGPLGGYVMAILMRGLELAVDDAERSARSVTTHFLRPPADGPVQVSATIERAGRSLSTVSGRLSQDGKLIALALGAYSKAWEGPERDNAPMPDAEPPVADERPPPTATATSLPATSRARTRRRSPSASRCSIASASHRSAAPTAVRRVGGSACASGGLWTPE